MNDNFTSNKPQQVLKISFEMTMSVRFDWSNKHFKFDLITFEKDNVFKVKT